MRLEAVNEIIKQAKAIEARSHRLERVLADQTRHLPEVIRIDGERPVANLLSFVIDYVELAPMMLNCIESSARSAHIETIFQPFLSTALEYFVHPSIILQAMSGLDGLMVRAYQCHRLIEELYENNKSLRNSKICELESTQANLLVHYLIGEPFSNEIDEAVLFTVSQLVNIPKYYHIDLAAYIEDAHSLQWQQLSRNWQRLLPAHSIQLRFVNDYH